ncbi:hypothetical protein CSB09_03035 [Candidatus Gracilibacteria bacterium]|nr:MAG: hypothetical protein CSB09_03035 [Candidatus Gracilibacteria bacterium]
MIFAKDLDTKILHKHLDFLKSIFLEKLESLKAITTKKNVIFLSQNIIDEYKISPSLFRNKLFEIRNEFTHRGYTFFIKPHPLENTSYYKGQFDIIDKTIPSELLDIYFGDKETIYITFFSTVILNLQFGKKYLIGDIGFGENERSIIDLLYEKYKIPFLLIK